MSSPPLCALCNQAERHHDPLIPDEYYPIHYHMGCYNGEEGRRWREAQGRRDPGYARYQQMIRAGRQVACGACGSEENHLRPKLIGHSPRFELCCTRYDRYSVGLGPYADPPLADLLFELNDRFRRGVDLAGIEQAVEELAREDEARVSSGGCPCGGTFSLRGRPRCHRCHEVLLDSHFHFNAGP